MEATYSNRLAVNLVDAGTQGGVSEQAECHYLVPHFPGPWSVRTY